MSLDHRTTHIEAGAKTGRTLVAFTCDWRQYRKGETVSLPTDVAADALKAGAGQIVSDAAIITKSFERRQIDLPAVIVPNAIMKADGARVIEGIASTATPDRAGDVVEPAGLGLTLYRRNPVVLYQHQADQPIGRAIDVRVDGQTLRAVIELAAEGVNAIADRAWRLVQAGIVRALSVGFLPKEVKPMPDGRGLHFVKSDLLEISLVSVPANPEALITPALFPSSARSAESARITPFQAYSAVTSRTSRRDERRRQRESIDNPAADIYRTAKARGHERLATVARDLAVRQVFDNLDRERFRDAVDQLKGEPTRRERRVSAEARRLVETVR